MSFGIANINDISQFVMKFLCLNINSSLKFDLSKLIVPIVVLVSHAFTFYLGFDDKVDDIFMLRVHFKSIPSITWGQKLKINMLIQQFYFVMNFFHFAKKNGIGIFVTDSILNKDSPKINSY
jgi:hypothetical protein